MIAIDGPSGAGKSTLARQLAEKLNFLFVDTGAMFRSVAVALRSKGIDLDSQVDIENALPSLNLRYLGRSDELIFDGDHNLTREIRSPENSLLASKVSAYGSVRDFLLSFQRELAAGKNCVLEGRDIGTVVFPNAFCKIYLTASLEARTDRRLEQLLGQGQTVEREQVFEEIRQRDQNDMGRKIAPLKKASDAIEVDSSALSQTEVLSELETIVRKRAKLVGLEI